MSANVNVTRGYSMLGALAFIEETFDEATRRRIYDSLSPPVAASIDSYKPVEWYDRVHFIELLRGIVAEHSTEPESYQALVACGERIAKMAASTFLKLLMRMLTPTIFAKKIPDIWRRDNKCGRFEADLSQVNDRVLVMHMLDMKGYDHIGPVAVGWITFAMGAMGKRGVLYKLDGWSLATPGPDEMHVEVRWQQ